MMISARKNWKKNTYESDQPKNKNYWKESLEHYKTGRYESEK